MGQKCEICGKAPQMGNQVTTRGKAKYLGGVGTKITVRGTNRSARVCTQCIRSGAVTKVVRAAPFKLLPTG